MTAIDTLIHTNPRVNPVIGVTGFAWQIHIPLPQN